MDVRLGLDPVSSQNGRQLGFWYLRKVWAIGVQSNNRW
jgi:hypothetical protein